MYTIQESLKFRDALSEIFMEQLLGLTNPAPLSLTTLAINLLLAAVLASIVAWVYINYGRSLSNRAKFAQTLPVLALITVLIISIVKSSLALSLGLVGALSIVRFRTAIKEPEELIYLFMAIAIGLGLGADQRWPTVLAILHHPGVFAGSPFSGAATGEEQPVLQHCCPRWRSDFQPHQRGAAQVMLTRPNCAVLTPRRRICKRLISSDVLMTLL